MIQITSDNWRYGDLYRGSRRKFCFTRLLAEGHFARILKYIVSNLLERKLFERDSI